MKPSQASPKFKIGCLGFLSEKKAQAYYHERLIPKSPINSGVLEGEFFGKVEKNSQNGKWSSNRTSLGSTKTQLSFAKIAYQETGLIVDHHWEWGTSDMGVGVVSYIVLFGETTVKCPGYFFEKCFEEISAFNESVTKGLPHE